LDQFFKNLQEFVIVGVVEQHKLRFYTTGDSAIEVLVKTSLFPVSALAQNGVERR
jgi:hypothetical protein